MQGELTLVGNDRPLAFDLALGDDGTVQRQRRRQADGLGMIAPYSTLFGTLKVVDEVEVELVATLPQSR